MMQFLRLSVALLAAGVTAQAATNTAAIICAAGRYSVEGFDVDPGNTVVVTITNADTAPHNLVICKPGLGVGAGVATRILHMPAAEAEARHFIPDDPRILIPSSVLQPGQAQTITFTAPDMEGDYAYVSTLPGQLGTMRGVMRVGGPRPALGRLQFAEYAGRWDRLPDFKSLKPVRQGPLVNQPLSVEIADRTSDFGLDFHGELAAPKDGDYTFFLDADDGARVWIDDKKVVELDGGHRFGDEHAAKVALSRGYHPFRLEYYQTSGAAQLSLGWSGPGFSRLELADDPKYPTAPGQLRPAAGDVPLVVRAAVEDGPVRGLSVGFGGGLNYCFDTATCALAFGWKGGFLDRGPDIGYDIRDRGGRPVKTLGDRFALGDRAACPLRVRKPAETLPVRFLGYRRHGTDAPFLHFRAGDLDVYERILPLPTGDGFQVHMDVSPTPWRVFYAADAEGLDISSPQGELKGGWISFDGIAARSFDILLRRK